MSENLAAKRLVGLIPAIMQRWDDRVRAEVSPAAGATEVVLRDSLPKMLEVMAKVLGDRTDPRTAARDLAYLTVHGKERANQTTYSLGEQIREFHILQEVVLEALEPDHLLDTRDRGVIIQYVNEMVRVTAGEFVREVIGYETKRKELVSRSLTTADRTTSSLFDSCDVDTRSSASRCGSMGPSTRPPGSFRASGSSDRSVRHGYRGWRLRSRGARFRRDLPTMTARPATGRGLFDLGAAVD